jgi:DNA-binding MarR family transcriptional regulator
MPADMAQVPEADTLTRRAAARPVDRVVEAGLVVRHRRSIHVVLTPAGHAVLERAICRAEQPSPPEDLTERR